jgi:copper(I)-binding protein
MRIRLLALAFLAATPALAEDHDHDHDAHVAEAEGVRVVHAWTPAVRAGADALLYMEIENRSDAEALLTGASALGEPLELVGFAYGADGEIWRALPGLPVPAGGEVRLEPQVLALRLAAVPFDLVEGAGLEVEVALGDARLQAEVEIGAAGATAHSHAGHDH